MMHPVLRAVTRELGLRGGLIDVYKMFWPLIETSEFKENWHHRLMCDYLEALVRGEKKDLIFNVPPGTGKSSLVNVVLPLYIWLRDPTRRVVVASFDANLVLRDARRHAGVMESELWRDCFADVCQLPKTYADGLFINDKSGWRMSTSIPRGKIMGWHADIHIYDDPLKPDDATSKVKLAKAKEWIATTATSRFRDINDRRRVLIMQRLHEDDPSGYLEEMGFEVVRLPMRYEKSYSHPRDPRTQEGELLWPEVKPESAVQAMEKELGPMGVAAQLQQRPAPEGGAVFRKEWLRFWHPVDQKPAHTLMYPDAPRCELPRKFDRLLQSWDMAFLDQENSDWVVGQVWGLKDSDLYLLDQVRGRWDAPTTAKQVLKLSAKWPRARAKLIEKKANGPAVIAMLKKRLTGLIAIDPDGGKEARANAAAPLFESRNVVLPDPLVCSWTQAYLHELFLFPNGKFDDQVDATSQALNYMDRKKLLGQKLSDVIIKGGWRL